MIAFSVIFWFLFYTPLAILGNHLDNGIAMVLICQDNSQSAEKCTKLERNINGESSLVLVSGKDFEHDGDWSILPIIPQLGKLISRASWVVFLREDTAVNMEQLQRVLSVYNSTGDTFIGKALYDQEPTIIHHFSPRTDLPFPLLPAGFAMSYHLFKKLENELSNEMENKADFAIDAAYELASFIKDKANGPFLSNSNRFCLKPAPACATWISIQPAHPPANLNRIVFAVKTCKQFHKDRIPVVKSTWGKEAKHIEYFSDAEDREVPTTVLNVENVPHGHCSKTRAIIRTLRGRFKKEPKLQWAVITDDDTLLSVQRVQELLGTYNHSEPLAIGERYGYNLLNDGGYNYLTGGGGVILSRGLLAEFGKNSCNCPSPTTPDDMFLFGVCLKRLRLTMVGSPLFHQARPNDYSKDYLDIGKPISFHKHWMIDPIKVYREWLHESPDLPEHIEL